MRRSPKTTTPDEAASSQLIQRLDGCVFEGMAVL